MAEEKVVDRNGVKQLYKKTREGLLNETALEDINYISGETLPGQSFTFSRSKNDDYVKEGEGTIVDSGFVYGKAKEVIVTVSGNIANAYGSGKTPGIRFNIKLPSGGRWFVNGSRIWAGGSVIYTLSKTTGSPSNSLDYSENIPFYIARVK